MRISNLKINKTQKLNFNKKKINKENINNIKKISNTYNQSFEEILDEKIKVYKK